MLSPLLILGIIAWIAVYMIVSHAQLPAYFYWIGAIGTFLILTLASHKYFVWLLASLVSRGAGLLGSLTHSFSVYPFPAMLMIHTNSGTLNLLIDYECSGIIEMNAYLSLLFFFPIYKLHEKAVLGLLGSLWLYFINVLRVSLVGIVVHYCNLGALFWVHNVIGRLIFYVLTIWMYYLVFTHSKLIERLLKSSQAAAGA
jgi:exosortase family protein XrtG